MAHEVFISHSSGDKATADAVCAALEASGVRCWIAPRDILPGQSWAEAIVNAISASRVMVVILSSRSNSSNQVLREVERAVTKGVVIVPFRIEDVQPTQAMEYYLSTPHWLDALTPPLEQHIQSLVAAVGSFLGTEPAPAPAPPDPVAEVRRRMLASGSARDLRECSYLLDGFLAKNPHHAEARLLKDQIEMAIRRETQPARPYAAMAAPPPRVAARGGLGLKILLALVCLLLALGAFFLLRRLL
ncbi:MAG: toll/interleukin-1 receptor domain-containing protein [Pyrinomonadaceae bacterium]